MRVASSLAFTGLSFGLGLAACANDPLYIPGPMTLEAGVADPANMGRLTQAKASVLLPIKTETADDAKQRAALAATIDPIEVPYVRVGDLEIEIEWTVTNLDTSKNTLMPQAKIELNGANEYFAYDPSTIVLSADPEEATPAPGLDGDVPIDVAPGAQVSGLFTEDNVREAAIDLDQITRGHFNPFAATLTISKNAASFQPLTPLMPGAVDDRGQEIEQMPDGPPIPREAFAGFTRIDIVFKPNTHMALDYSIRIRDIRGIMHDLLLTAETEKPGELQTFDPMDFTVTVATPVPATP
jgi:hypothetical protein